jgi:hypothetical protein
MLNSLLVLSLLGAASLGSAEREESQHSCSDRICVADGSFELTDQDAASLEGILAEYQQDGYDYEIVTIRSVISGSVYLLSASKPDYYGIEVVLAKEQGGWTVLKAVESVF